MNPTTDSSASGSIGAPFRTGRALALALVAPLLLVILASQRPAAAAPGESIPSTIVTLQAESDNTLYESSGGALSNGAGIYLFAGKTAGGDIRRAVLRFDVAGAIPADAQIVSAQLTLWMDKTKAGNVPVSLHRLTDDWGEGASDASGDEGGGTQAMTGDATWIHTFFDTATWTRPGGEFAATASATTQVGDAERGYTWPSTRTVVADVQGWLDHGSSNHGWLVKGDETASTTAKRFHSREHEEEATRPILVVEYRPAAGNDHRIYLPIVARGAAHRQ